MNVRRGGHLKTTIQRLVCLTLLSLCPAAASAQTRETPATDLSSPDQVMLQQDMQEILKRPEFRHLTRERQLTQDTDVDLDDWIQDSSSKPSHSANAISDFTGAVFTMLSYASVICACVLVLYLLYKAAIGYQRPGKNKADIDTTQLQGEMVLEETISPAELAASTYLERAQTLAKAGEYHKAIIQLLYGSMSYIERSGWIRFRKGLTYRDYLRAARPHGLPGESLRQMVRTYEPLGFGRREATREHFESTLQHYEAAFQQKT